jgi:hypothetical protein
MMAMCVLAATTLGLSTASASASTFFVATTGNNANDCASASTPCLTIAGAITRARAAADTATINVGPGTFSGNVSLDSAADSGTAIVGSGSGGGGTVIQGSPNSSPAVTFSTNSSDNALSHLKVINSLGGNDDAISAQTHVTLTDVAVDVHNPGSANGISVGFSPVTFDSGSVTMESGASGRGFSTNIGGLTVRASTITVAAGATATAINTSIGPLTLTGSTINVGPNGGGAVLTGASSSTISDTTINQASSSGQGIVSQVAAMKLANVTVTMTNAAGTQLAVESAQGDATIDHLTVSGPWHGPGLIIVGNATIRDTRVTTPAGSTSPAAEFVEGGSGGRSAVVQRSVFQQGAPTVPNVILLGADMVLDSSELLGGVEGVFASHSSGKARTVSILGSTIDAGALGTRDGAGTYALYGTVSGGSNSALTLLARGSILVDSQLADVSGANSLTIACTASDAPDQTQAADATHGAINCASGANGNAATNPLTGLFAGAAPDYGLNPSSSAVDGVPDAAFSPPAGITLSTTDLAGNPRDVDGNGNCVALRDKGALELQGHAGTVPAPAIAGPAGGVAGTQIPLTVSSPNMPAGTAVTYSWVFTGPSVGTGPSVTPTFPAAGPATATVTASAGDACTATATKQLTITPAITIDQITNLKIAPSAFFAAPSGASTAAAKKTGATVSYVGTQPASTLFRVQRKARGRKVGKRCVKPTKKNASKKPCSRYLPVGSFSHTDAAAGAIHFRFTGRLNNKKLRAGSYRLRAVPTNAAGAGRVATAGFRIKK